MRKNVVILLLLLLASGGVVSQTKDFVTEAWATQQFGDRFISAKEAGFDNLVIPFTRKDLLFDKMSLLAPVACSNGSQEYLLVQARLIPNLYEANDTLSLIEAEQLVSLINRAKRNFPNSQELKFFKTRDRTLSQGREYTKTIVSDGLNQYVIDLPSDVSVVCMEKNCVSFITDEKDKISISIGLTKINGLESEINASVMTLVKLIPDQ